MLVPLLLALRMSVHVMNDINTGIMSQAMIQINALIDETFLPCGSSSILAVTIKEVECLIFFHCVNHFELMHDARVFTQNKNCKKFMV